MLPLGIEGYKISRSHGKCVGHHHIERRDHEPLENMLQLPKNRRIQGESFGLNWRAILPLQSKSRRPVAQHKVVLRPWERPVLPG